MATFGNLPVVSYETYKSIVFVFSLFPLVTPFQWIPFGQAWYQTGKTSGHSRVNIPGKIAWFTMEVPGFLSLLYTMNVLPAKLGITQLPFENKVLGGLFVTHYLYRAILCPILNPSMSPTNWFVWAFALVFQFANGLSIGGWLGGYGPTTRADWKNHTFNLQSPGIMEFGLFVWAFGLLGNIYHDEALRDIRREASRKQALEQKKRDDKSSGKAKGVDKVYVIPEAGMFKYILYPHYLFEWIEWAGFWMMAGWSCTPAKNFFLNEVTTMVARAYEGKQWYIQKFGKDKVGSRKAVIPGLL